VHNSASTGLLVLKDDAAIAASPAARRPTR
jgi:hypothetical protein